MGRVKFQIIYRVRAIRLRREVSGAPSNQTLLVLNFLILSYNKQLENSFLNHTLDIIRKKFKERYKNPQNYEKISKYVLLGLEFTDLEYMQLFLDFSKTFDKNLDFQFDIYEFIDLIEYFWNEDLIGSRDIQAIINMTGVNAKFKKKVGKESAEKESLSFSKLAYKKLYDILTDVK